MIIDKPMPHVARIAEESRLLVFELLLIGQFSERFLDDRVAEVSNGLPYHLFRAEVMVQLIRAGYRSKSPPNRGRYRVERIWSHG